jgi:Domain of unknown function (DUF4115)
VAAYRAQQPPEPVLAAAPRALVRPGGVGRGPNWPVLAVAGGLVVLVVSLWGLLPGPQPSDAQPASVADPAPARAAAAARAAPTAAARPRAAPRTVTVVLRYGAASWTRVRADGRVAFEGTPGPGQRRSFRARRSLELTLGYPAGVRLSVNGRHLGVPDRSGNPWRGSFTPATRSLGEPRASGPGAGR